MTGKSVILTVCVRRSRGKGLWIISLFVMCTVAHQGTRRVVVTGIKGYPDSVCQKVTWRAVFFLISLAISFFSPTLTSRGSVVARGRPLYFASTSRACNVARGGPSAPTSRACEAARFLSECKAARGRPFCLYFSCTQVYFKLGIRAMQLPVHAST